MDFASLRAELLDDPAGAGYATPLGAGDDAAAAALLNEPRTPGRKAGARLTALGVLDVLGPEAGTAFLAAVEAASPGVPVLAMANRILWMVSGGGLDFGDPRLHAQLDGLVAAGIVQAGHAETLKAYGTRPWSRAEVVLGDGARVTDADVARALRG